jgi:uncharacterized protein (TIGR02246 family)
MKTRLFVLAGLAISFALPTYAQQTNTPDPRLLQRLVALIKNFEDAYNDNDAVTLATLFRDDAVLVTQEGPVNGGQAIEKWYADHFKGVHFSDTLITVDQDSPHIVGTDGKGIWATGAWSAHNRYTLTVDVIEHRSFFTLGNWNASTRLKWRVQEGNGSILREGVSLGEGHRSNMAGYLTAGAVSQDSYNVARPI